MLRKTLFALATLAGMATYAQQPYHVVVGGTVLGCTPNSFVNITTMNGTQPAIDIDVPVLPPQCFFSINLDMATQGGGFIITTQCMGVTQSQTVQYQVPAIGDSTGVFVTFDCGNTLTDCAGVVGGSDLPGTPCTTFLGEAGTWSSDCFCVADSGAVDCEGVLNGPAQPGTPCGTPNGLMGTWSVDCECVPNTTNCQACIELGPVINPNGEAIPFAVLGASCSQGTAPINYQINWGDGVVNSSGDHAYNAPGMYGVCITIADANGCTSTACDTLVVDANGGISTGPGYFDCLQVLNGPNVPGSPCDDGDPNTVDDVWGINCICQGTDPGAFCEAAMNVSQNAPWVISATGTGTGTAPLTFAWWLPDGSTTSGDAVSFSVSAAGTFLLCLTVTDSEACTVTTCDSLYVDSLGVLSDGPLYFDCLQVPNGPALPGTPCASPAGGAGTWNANCECVPNTNTCQACIELGPVINPSGEAIPFAVLGASCSQGTAPINYQISWGDGVVNSSGDHAYNAPGMYGVCITIADASGCTSTACDTLIVAADGSVTTTPDTTVYDCLQIPNGPNMPGAPCQMNGLIGFWDESCACVPNTPGECEAGFWILQAYENGDSTGTPVPNTLWVWNLTNGGTGMYQFLWNFGDGTSSTEAFPTHVYPDSGPYELCLTITDSEGCTDTHCDSLYVNEDGLYNGLIGNNGSRAALTINIVNPLTMAIGETRTLSALTLWPNPTRERLNLVFDGRMAGMARIEVIDLTGQVVLNWQERVQLGHNRIGVEVTSLSAGMHAIRVSQGSQVVTQRFIRE
jgi:PKD repeat protein